MCINTIQVYVYLESVERVVILDGEDMVVRTDTFQLDDDAPATDDVIDLDVCDCVTHSDSRTSE